MSADGHRQATRLAQHEAALPSLLESLLAEVPAFKPEKPAATAARPRPDPAVEAAPGTGTAPTLKPAPTPPLNEPSSEDAPQPSWAQQSFRVLLFHIGCLRFAMPLAQMRAVSLLPQRRTRVPGRAPWHLGLVRVRNASVAVVELGTLLEVDAACERARYLLLIADGSVAIVCDAIGEAVMVEPRRVRWSRGGERRAWLAGVLSDEMCLLLDAEAIDDMIRHG